MPCVAGLGTLTLGADRNIWFTDAGRGQVGRITPSGQVLQFLVANVAGGEHTIVAGPDGNIWTLARALNQSQSDWVVRITPAGAITKFAAGQPGTSVDSITVGPDRNLWVTKVQGGGIGRMTPSGALTEFPGPGGPRGIATGPDGNLWFTDSSQVGRMTITGATDFYPVGNDPSIPLGDIIAGPDGNLWFASYDGLWRISPATGAIVRVPMPSGAHLGSLVSGPDGNVWFSDNGLNAIGRITTTGVIREFPLPRRGSYPIGIAVGADGRIWFAETSRGVVGSIGVKVPEIRFRVNPTLFDDSSTRAIPIRNVGDATLAITAVRVTGIDLSLFTKSSDTCSGKALPPNATCEIKLVHNAGGPAGVQSAYLEVSDNATGSPQRISLLGHAPACQLPMVVTPSTGGPPQPLHVNIRTGETVSPAGDGFTRSADGTVIRTIGSPVLTGNSAGYFDRQAGRFLPTVSGLVSPDGSRYTYITVGDSITRNAIHVVDVSSGRDRAVSVPSDSWGPIAFTDRGIYLHKAYEGIRPGLWLLNPDTGMLTTVLTDQVVAAVSGSYAWILSRNTADKLPEPPSMGTPYNTILRRDLNTGETTTWVYRPGTDISVIPIKGGRAVLSVRDSVGSTLFWSTASNQAIRMEFPFTADAYSPSVGGFEPDANGIWIGSPDGVYLWTDRTRAVLVSAVAGTPAGTCA